MEPLEEHTNKCFPEPEDDTGLFSYVHRMLCDRMFDV